MRVCIHTRTHTYTHTHTHTHACTGPVSICVNAGVWDDYTGGVMTQKACGGYAMG